MAYATSFELETLLGGQFTAEDHLRADLLLDLASGRIDTALGQPVSQVVNDTVTLDGTGTPVLVLPFFPVTAVGAVIADGVTLVFGDDFAWNDAGILTRVGGCWPARPRSVQVTFTHGYAVIPRSVRGVNARIARIWFENPIDLQSETFVDYSYRVSSQRDDRVEKILGEIRAFGLR